MKSGLFKPAIRGLLISCLTAQGHPDAALALAERLLELAETTRRMGRVTEVLALQALAFQEKKDLPFALAALERAIALAQPERAIRVFLDEGEPMVKLLALARAHRIGGGFATELLSVVALPTQNPADDQAQPEKGVSVGLEAPREKIALVEPLSARELEVLQCIDAGYSNQEIADRFVISVKTVKRHISNIYGKLGVTSRTQAVSVGRALKLL